MVPGACMQQLQLLGVGSILLTSGTLSPLASFADSFVRRCCFVLPSLHLWTEYCISDHPRKQARHCPISSTISHNTSGFLTHVLFRMEVWIGVVPRGPSSTALNSSYRARDTATYKSELGNAILSFADVVPDGMLVFFASYTALTSSLAFWQSPESGSPTLWCASRQGLRFANSQQAEARSHQAFDN